MNYELWGNIKKRFKDKENKLVITSGVKDGERGKTVVADYTTMYKINMLQEPNVQYSNIASILWIWKGYNF